MKQFEEREVTVGELRQLFTSGEYEIEINTPDGFQPIVSWWDKGKLPMVSLKTEGGLETRCATNHLLQREDDVWVLSSELSVSDKVLTINGIDVVNEMNFLPEEECYDFEVGHSNHRYWGDGFSSHNSGKSYIATANIIRWCQKNNVWPIVIDTENALDQMWLDNLPDIDTSENAMDKYNGATIDDVSKFLGKFVEDYIESQGSKPYADRQRAVVIIDSIGMLITPNQEKQFMEGDQKGDMGIKAKQVTAMLRVLMAKIATQPIGVIGTNHVFDSQDKYKPDSIPGGKMLEFASSVIVQMNKYLLKEDEDGNKLVDGAVAGITSTCVVRKSRYAKPFEKVKILLPYHEGMNPYSGLFDLFTAKGVLKKQGIKYTYTSPETGEIFLQSKKEIRKSGLLDQIMSEWSHWENATIKVGFDETEGASVINGEDDE